MRIPKISVIMLTYNREMLVRRMIESILAQTFTDFEFIIVDNGSTDRSGVIVDEYARKDARISVIHRERGNIGSGRNAGLKIATGDYITFVDDDDTCEPDLLEFLYTLAIEYNSDVSICGAMKDEDGEVIPVGVFNDILVMNAEQAIIALMWRKRYNTGFPTKLISRKVYQGLYFDEVGRYDDISLMYKVLGNAGTVVSYGLPKYRVYRHRGNNSCITTKDGLITAEYLESYRNAYRERTVWLCKHFPQQSNYWWYFDWSFQISMVNKIFINKLNGCAAHLLEMKSELAEHKGEFLASPHILDFEIKWVERYI